MTNSLGDAPIQPEYREKMNAIAMALDELFNGDARHGDRQTGFVLLVFPFGSNDGCYNYISNGANRKDIVVMLKEQIKRFEGQLEMTGTASSVL